MGLPQPGENYLLPPEVGSHDKDSPRPHVVLSPANRNDLVITLAFGSTSALQALRYHAPYVVVDKRSPMFEVTGLDETTYVYPSRLAVCLLSEMPRRSLGRVVDEFPELRDKQLPRALGLGTGVRGQVGAASRSRRGQIARFTDDFADLIGFQFGVVVSWPPYSLQDQVQNVVPLGDASEYAEVAPNFSVSGKSWISQVGSFQSVLLWADLIQGAYDGGSHLAPEERDIEAYLAEPVDTQTMELLDRALAARLFNTRLEDVIAVHSETE